MRYDPFSPICYQCTLSLPGFLMFSGGTERVHWEQMSQRVQFKCLKAAEPL